MKNKKVRIAQPQVTAFEKPKWFQNKNTLITILFLYALLIYGNTLFNKYAQDDAIVITENMFTKQGLKGIPGILSNDTFYGFFKKSGKDKLVSGGRYRPLSQVTFAAEYQFFGLNPMISHLINILLYGLLGIILFKFLLLLLKNIFKDNFLTGFAFVGSMIFLSHPVHTEVVANIKGRDELFSLLFGLLAMFFTIKYIISGKKNLQVYVFISFLAALFSKENSVTLIAVVSLMLLMFYHDRKISYFQLLVPYLASTVIFLTVRTSILGLDFGGESNELMNNPFIKFVGGQWIDLSFAEKFATIIYSMGKYILLLLFPHPLTNDYYPRHIPVMNFSDWQVILSLLVYLIIIYIAFRFFKKNRIISFGIFFYLITISIVSNIIFPVGTNMSERFLFMPSVGFAILLSYLLVQLFNKAAKVSITVFFVMIFLFSFKTITRNMVWKDDFTLYTTDVKVSTKSAKALNAAGGSLVDAAFKEKNDGKKKIMLNQAKKYLDDALKIHPDYANALLISGNADYFLENYESAVAKYEELIAKNPGFEDAKKNFPVILREAGKYFGEKRNDLIKSLDYLSKSYALDSTDYETVRLYGIANAFSGNLNKALFLFKKGVELQPGNAGANQNLGNIYYNMGDRINGKKYHDIAKTIDPGIFEKK
ncbi:MAG: hypothetical protein ACM3PT_03870 [Deltaproteobacteria bacterium]